MNTLFTMTFLFRIIIFSFFSSLFFTSTVSANQLLNPATLISPPNNPGWSDTNALSPENITFSRNNNGDSEGDVPLRFWFYFYLIKWNRSPWEQHTTTCTNGAGVTAITKNISEGYYAWQIPTIDASQSSSPWYRWIDNNNDGTLDRTLLGVKTQLSSTCAYNCFYISPSGNDTNPGTSVAPWKTWAYTLKQLDPGDTLIAKMERGPMVLRALDFLLHVLPVHLCLLLIAHQVIRTGHPHRGLRLKLRMNGRLS